MAKRNGKPEPDVLNSDTARQVGPPNGRPKTVATTSDRITPAVLGTETLSPSELEDLSRKYGVAFASSLKDFAPAAPFVQSVPVSYARKHLIVALIPDGGPPDTLLVAIGNPQSWQQLDVIARLLDRSIRPAFSPASEVLQAINRSYQSYDTKTEAIIGDMDQREDPIFRLDVPTGKEDLLELANRPPVIRLVNSLLFDAVKARASDIHAQPGEDGLVVRQRIDGILTDTVTIPKEYQEEVISRLKVMGRMNIAEKRLPQDGRASVQLGDHLIDLRIASLPTSFGERVVVRFLDKGARLYTLGELGMDAHSLGMFRRLIHLEHGLLLVTGPTGSGKSTTLYAVLQEIDHRNLNVLTLEDPIEYQLEGISQTQINPKKGLTFATGLRNVLRQDPDIIMVGEIRDHETAIMAIQSAMTGHLVFSTLHTNDAASAVARLLDLGIEPYLVASCLVGVLAQRLVRRICPHCTTAYTPSPSEVGLLGSGDVVSMATSLYRGSGCTNCRGTGYHGRIGIFELLPITDAIRDLIQARSTASQIRSSAVEQGMLRLWQDGVRKATEGVTTIDEVARVTMRD